MRPQECSSRGFALIEVLIAITLLTVAMVGIPRLMAGVPAIALRATADELANKLRLVNGQAIRSGRTVRVTFDASARTYLLLHESAPHRLPDVVERMTLRAAIERPEAGPSGMLMIQFFADGTSDGGVITLANRVRAETVTVEWLTGRVRRTN